MFFSLISFIPALFSVANGTYPTVSILQSQKAKNAIDAPANVTTAGREASSEFNPAPQYFIPNLSSCLHVLINPSSPKSNA